MGGCSRKRGRQAPSMAPEGTLWFSRLGKQSCSVGHPRMWPSQLPLRRRASLGGGLPRQTMACPSGIADPASRPCSLGSAGRGDGQKKPDRTCHVSALPTAWSRRGSMWLLHCIFKTSPPLPAFSLPPAQKRALTVGMSEIIGF